jgi:hypothetical protein
MRTRIVMPNGATKTSPPGIDQMALTNSLKDVDG